MGNIVEFEEFVEKPHSEEVSVEKIYEQLMLKVVEEFISWNVDTEFLNEEKIKKEVVKRVVNEYDLDTFMCNMEEDISKVFRGMGILC